MLKQKNSERMKMLINEKILNQLVPIVVVVGLKVLIYFINRLITSNYYKTLLVKSE